MKVVLCLVLAVFLSAEVTQAEPGYQNCAKILAGALQPAVPLTLAIKNLALSIYKKQSLDLSGIKTFAAAVVVYTAVAQGLNFANGRYINTMDTDFQSLGSRIEAPHNVKRVLVINGMKDSATTSEVVVGNVRDRYPGAALTEITVRDPADMMRQLEVLNNQIDLPFDSIHIAAHGSVSKIELGQEAKDFGYQAEELKPLLAGSRLNRLTSNATTLWIWSCLTATVDANGKGNNIVETLNSAILTEGGKTIASHRNIRATQHISSVISRWTGFAIIEEALLASVRLMGSESGYSLIQPKVSIWQTTADGQSYRIYTE